MLSKLLLCFCLEGTSWHNTNSILVFITKFCYKIAIPDWQKAEVYYLHCFKVFRFIILELVYFSRPCEPVTTSTTPVKCCNWDVCVWKLFSVKMVVTLMWAVIHVYLFKQTPVNCRSWQLPVLDEGDLGICLWHH